MKFDFFVFFISITTFVFIIDGNKLIASGEFTEVLNRNESTNLEDHCTRCGGDIILDDFAKLSFDNFSTKKNKECIWRIIVPEHDHEILLHFENFEKKKSDNCLDNYIEVRDGLSSKAPLIQRICHSLLPTMHSTSGLLFIKFVNNEPDIDLKFSASIEKIYNMCHHHENPCEHHCTYTWPKYICSCDEGFRLSSDGKHCINNTYGFIDSHSCINIKGTENYKCQWKIPVPNDYRIVLNFTYFNLEREQDKNFYSCSENNHIKIVNQLHNGTLEIVGPYCGSLRPTAKISKGEIIGIEFRTNIKALNSTFIANYYTIKDECEFNDEGCEGYHKKGILSSEDYSSEFYYQDDYIQ